VHGRAAKRLLAAAARELGVFQECVIGRKPAITLQDCVGEGSAFHCLHRERMLAK
jgi:hypothetical protein